MIKKVYKLINSVLSWFEKYWSIPLLIAILIASFIFYLSSIPASGFPAGGLGIKAKIYHIGIYALLALFLSLAIIRKKINNKSLIIIAILMAVAYAITDEIHQFFVLGRHCSIRDVFIDTTGVLMAIVFYYALRE